MYALILIVHVIIAIFLIIVILLQGGRGGLGETLGGAAAQSLFGGSANVVMTRVTAICAGLFMVTCLSLALLSTSAKNLSVVDRIPAAAPGALPLTLPPASMPETIPAAQPEPAGQPATSSASAPIEPKNSSATSSKAAAQKTP